MRKQTPATIKAESKDPLRFCCPECHKGIKDEQANRERRRDYPGTCKHCGCDYLMRVTASGIRQGKRLPTQLEIAPEAVKRYRDERPATSPVRRSLPESDRPQQEREAAYAAGRSARVHGYARTNNPWSTKTASHERNRAAWWLGWDSENERRAAAA